MFCRCMLGWFGRFYERWTYEDFRRVDPDGCAPGRLVEQDEGEQQDDDRDRGAHRLAARRGRVRLRAGLWVS
jgi:hypothetical protein